MNYRINVEKFKNGWSFHTPVWDYPDLPLRTLSENSLVSGIDTMLDSFYDKYGIFDIIISNEELILESLENIVLSWTLGDRYNPLNGGNWYEDEYTNQGWLCPVLFDYFTPCPKKLYLYIVEKKFNSELLEDEQKQDEINFCKNIFRE